MKTLPVVICAVQLWLAPLAGAQQMTLTRPAASPLNPSVSDAGVLFLLIQPSPRANGMGGASVSSETNDAMGVAFNPALLGRLVRENYFGIEFYPTKADWLPVFGGLTYDAKTVFLGFDLGRLYQGVPVSLGLAYTRVFLDLGEQLVTDESGNVLGTFRSSERVNVWTIGLGIDYVIKAGTGWSFKNIDSRLSPIGAGSERGDGNAKANAHDFGLVVHLPIHEAFSKLTATSLDIRPGLSPTLGAGFGYSRSNVGDEISYIEAAQADPLPRIARIGVSASAGLAYKTEAQAWQLVRFEMLSEAEQVLVHRFFDGSFKYTDGIGDIEFWNNLVRGKAASADIVKVKGWELNLLEILSLRGGSHEDPDGPVIYHSHGVGVSLRGVFKAMRTLGPEFQKGGTLDLLTRHLDLQFNTSSLDIADGHPLSGTSFHGISISIF